MILTLLIILIALVVLMLCCLSFAGGYIVGANMQRSNSKPTKLTAEEQERREKADREARRRQKELENFWNYNGDEQEIPNGY